MGFNLGFKGLNTQLVLRSKHTPSRYENQPFNAIYGNNRNSVKANTNGNYI